MGRMETGMKEKFLEKVREKRGGVTRAAAVLLVLIAVMLVLIARPSWEAFRYRAEKTGCDQAMKSARDGLIIDFLSRFENGSVEEARVTLDEIMPERPNLCPAGGTVYLVRDEHGIFQPICGLHDSNIKERTQLNSTRAKDLLEAALNAEKEAKLREERRKQGQKTKEEQTDNGAESEETVVAKDPSGAEEIENEASSDTVGTDGMEEEAPIVVILNGRELECNRVLEEVQIQRGTRTTNGYEGVVAFYGLEGEGDFKSGAVKEGEIAYFVYADEDYCAIWHAYDGWTGDAYREI